MKEDSQVPGQDLISDIKNQIPPVPPIPPKPKFRFPILLATIIALILIVGSATAAFFVVSKVATKKACTLEAKICPDGSSVGRTGPNCSFAPCPTSSKTDETANWKTFTDTDSIFEFKYPQETLPYFMDGGRFLNVHGYKFSSFPFDKKYRASSLQVSINIEPKDSDPYLADDADYFQGHIPTSAQVNTTTLNGTVWLIVSYNNKTGGYETDALLKRDDFILHIGFSTYDLKIWDTNKKLPEQILSTFKFTSPAGESTPTPTCMARPACLDATPRCMIAEPANGWCPTSSSCNSDSDCKGGAKCTVEGPIIAGQAPHKICIAPGEVAPL